MSSTVRHLIDRPHYLHQAMMFKDTDLIKVITGVRRCGKSSLLKLVESQIKSEGRAGIKCVELNLESRRNRVSSESQFYEYFAQRMSEEGRTYIFADEVQRIERWQDAINALRVDFDCDIYITGSNAYLLSSELSTYLSGRYVEVKMLPLTFGEYLRFCNISFPEGSNVSIDSSGSPILFDDMFERFLLYGGFPAISSPDLSQEAHRAYMSSLYDAIATRDIVNRERRIGESRIADPSLLKTIAEYLVDNIGNRSSPGRMTNVLRDAGRDTTNKTVSSYIDALCDAYVLYKAPRYDLHGKDILRTNPKYYVVDTGLRTFLAGYKRADIGRVFENATYLQLRYEGYEVHVGKLYQKEIDFIAEKDGLRLYVQATDSIADETTLQRELAPLRAIRDSYPKVIVVRTAAHSYNIDGIDIVTAKDFFCKNVS